MGEVEYPFENLYEDFFKGESLRQRGKTIYTKCGQEKMSYRLYANGHYIQTFYLGDRKTQGMRCLFNKVVVHWKYDTNGKVIGKRKAV